MGGDNVLAAADTEWNSANGNGRTAAAIGQRLGQLPSYASSNSLNAGLFQEKSGRGHDACADQLLANAAS